jgi:hypothetical protein
MEMTGISQDLCIKQTNKQQKKTYTHTHTHTHKINLSQVPVAQDADIKRIMI